MFARPTITASRSLDSRDNRRAHQRNATHPCFTPRRTLVPGHMAGAAPAIAQVWGWHTAGVHAAHSRTRWQHSTAAEQLCMATLLPTHLLAGFRACQGSPAPGDKLLLPYRHLNCCPAPGAILMSSYTTLPACGLSVLFRKQTKKLLQTRHIFGTLSLTNRNLGLMSL